MRAARRILIAMLLALWTRVQAQERPAPPATKDEKSAEGGITEGAKRPSPRPAPDSRRSEEPRVRTPEEVEARRRSPFLLPPGATDQDNRYGAEDFRDLPPWSRANFFGISVRGRFFVYVLDQSGSMIDDDRMTRATIELRRSVAELQSPQRFEVFFYNDEATTMPGGPTAREADRRNKELLRSWLRLIDPDGGTSPRKAMLQALALRPDAVFLLSDGDFPDGTIETVAKANARKIPIHCVDMAGGLAGDALQRIAADSGGRYVSRPGNSRSPSSVR